MRSNDYPTTSAGGAGPKAAHGSGNAFIEFKQVNADVRQRPLFFTIFRNALVPNPKAELMRALGPRPGVLETCPSQRKSPSASWV
jgi:hypothetical protein